MSKKEKLTQVKEYIESLEDQLIKFGINPSNLMKDTEQDLLDLMMDLIEKEDIHEGCYKCINRFASHGKSFCQKCGTPLKKRVYHD